MNRIAIILVALQFIFLTGALAQATLQGQVFDKKGSPVIGASVYIFESYDGTSTDTLGNFSFETTLEGVQLLIISYMGYRETQIPLNLVGSTSPQFLTIEIAEDIMQMDPVVIAAGSFDAGAGSKGEVLKPLDIVTTAGATADIAGALNTLPGTTTVGEEGRVFVRGGDGDETMTFIDGLAVLDSYSTTIPNVATRSRFSPMMFSGMSFSTGGYSAEYGQALSSALILNTKDVAGTDRTDISLMTVGVDVSRTQTWENSSLAAKLEYTNLTPYFALLNQRIDWDHAPESIEANAAYRYEKDDFVLKTYFKGNHSFMDVNQQPVGQDTALPTGIRNNYLYLNTYMSDKISDNLYYRGGISYTRSNTSIYQNPSRINENLNGLHVKTAVFYDPVNTLTINAGNEVFINEFGFMHRDEGSLTEIDLTRKAILNATFVEANWALHKNISIRSGGRLEYNSRINEWSFDPRISAGFRLGEMGQLSAAWGIFRQRPRTEFVLREEQIGQEKASHLILSYQITRKERTLRLEGYSKKYNDLVKEGPENVLLNTGDGYAKGIDLFWRDPKTFRNVDYWISYSYLDSKRNYLDFPQQSIPNFVSTHNLSVVYKHWFQPLRSQLGLTYTYGSPRRYNDPNLTTFNSEKTNAYHNLSMNISYLMKPNVIIYFSMTNLTGRKNVFGYEFADQPNQEGRYIGQEIVPPADRFLFLGIFITLSKGNAMNQLPNL
ncbi:TonB-dependent receptor [Fulvivirga sedimenti]|uniref:TonB-dependent receptor n=1 Tax=Fulvivirga sedimenti TaxID=2879465 RepID=A0A9X1HL53_9BACT|nr:TonB-dependent receptor [Fulvivirga sedimenti]MCA6074274.1 TonB-dependent receptor [Fulvivirga sedimenti]